MHTVEFRDVTKIYPDSRGERVLPAIKGFSLQLRENEFFCLLGPSGCGKTTALNILAGFESATTGEVLHRGMPVVGPGADRGVIFQGDDSLMPWLTAWDNVVIGPRIKGMPKEKQKKVAQRLLDLVGLSGHDHKFPRELSGGMKQRIQIARVLANEPDMLLMDEPFGALDSQTRTLMHKELMRIWSRTKKTVLFISHDIHEALVLSDRIGVMRPGPASDIREIVTVEAPRPRNPTDRWVAEMYLYLQGLLAKGSEED